MTPDELVEKVARALCFRMGIDPDDALPEEIREGDGPWPYWKIFVGDATAAIAVLTPLLRAEALEEAAQAVWRMRRDPLTMHGDNHGKAGEWMRAALDDAEAALRAMIPK